MTQPVLFKQSFLIAILAGVQAVMPAVVAVASLYATIVFFGIVFNRSSEAIIIVAVLCLILVQAPREVTTQLTSARISSVADVIFRWLLLLAVMLAIGYVTKSLTRLPAPDIPHLGGGHAGGADILDAGHARGHAPLLDERVREPHAPSSPGTTTAAWSSRGVSRITRRCA